MLSRLLTLALLVTAPLVSAETLDLTNAKSNAAATVLVARFFESLGLDVNNKDEVQFGLRFGGYGLVLTPSSAPRTAVSSTPTSTIPATTPPTWKTPSS